MRITKVSFNRKFNLGNYESLDVYAEAELSQTDNPLDVWTVLRDNTEMWYRDSSKKPVGEQANQPIEQPKPQSTPQQTKQATQKTEKLPIEKEFPPELEMQLKFEDKGDYIRIAPAQFLGSETFSKVAAVVRGLGGEYISAGKDSHFEIYKRGQQ